LLLAVFDAEAIDHVVDSQGDKDWRFSLICCVDQAFIIDMNLSGAKKLVHKNYNRIISNPASKYRKIKTEFIVFYFRGSLGDKISH
jgi:hypothetical protein